MGHSANNVSQDYESEVTASRADVAAVLGAVVDGLSAGTLRLGEEDGEIDVKIPDELTLEIEFEADEDELSLELELEWSQPDVETAETTATSDEETAEPVLPVGAADGTGSFARFELFRDRRDEWRWRLRHRNGNVIATSGEGYTRKHNAQKGLRSVVQNAPGAEVTEP